MKLVKTYKNIKKNSTNDITDNNINNKNRHRKKKVKFNNNIRYIN